MHAVVVGTGFAGLGIAEALAWDGWTVTCLEREHISGLGCSQASLGLIFPAAPAAWPRPLVELTLESFSVFDDFLGGLTERAGVVTPVGDQGLLELAVSEGGFALLEREAADYALLGVEVEILNSDAVMALEPALRKSSGGLRFNQARYIDASSFLRALETSLKRAGGVVKHSTAASRLIVGGSRCLGVELEDGTTIGSDITVVATGGSTGGLVPRLDEVVTTSRGQWLSVRAESPLLRHAAYIEQLDLVPRLDGTLMLGATQEGPGRRVATIDGLGSLLDQFRRHVTSDEEIEFLRVNVGLRALTKDRIPLFGPSSLADGLYICGALYKNGVTLSPVLGSLFVRSLADGDWADFAPFAPRRLNV